MPKDFEACVRKSGNVTTKSLSGGRYQRICTIGGKTYPGHIKKGDSGTAAAIKKRGKHAK